MANEYLYKSRDALGNVIYTASKEDTDGKPVTRVEFKEPQSMVLTGSNVLIKKANSVSIPAGQTVTALTNVDVSRYSSFYAQLRPGTVSKFTVKAVVKRADGLGNLLVKDIQSFSSASNVITDTFEIQSPLVDIQIKNDNTTDGVLSEIYFCGLMQTKQPSTQNVSVLNQKENQAVTVTGSKEITSLFSGNATNLDSYTILGKTLDLTKYKKADLSIEKMSEPLIVYVKDYETNEILNLHMVSGAPFVTELPLQKDLNIEFARSGKQGEPPLPLEITAQVRGEY